MIAFCSRGRQYLYFLRLFGIQISLKRSLETKVSWYFALKMCENMRNPWRIISQQYLEISGSKSVIIHKAKMKTKIESSEFSESWSHGKGATSGNFSHR